MLWFLALVAILNLLLGYGLAVYLGANSPLPQPVAALPPRLEPAAAPQPPQAPAESTTLSNVTQAVEADGEADSRGASAAQPLAAREEMPRDAATGLVTRQYVEALLDTLAASDEAGGDPLSLALLEINASAESDQPLEDRLLRGLAGTVEEMLSDAQLAARYSDQQFLLLLPNENATQATERTEQMRQKIEATNYVADGKALRATVTCALAQVSNSERRSRWVENLEETLQEAKRYGGNRTFMHDGSSPAPVVPLELEVASQTCEI